MVETVIVAKLNQLTRRVKDVRGLLGLFEKQSGADLDRGIAGHRLGGGGLVDRPGDTYSMGRASL